MQKNVFCATLIISMLLIVPAFAEVSSVDPAVLAAQKQRIDVIKAVSPSVVAIFGAEGAGGGSGVLVTQDGYALTNFHVVSGAGNFMKCGLNDGKLYDAVIVSIDPTGDVALIKLLGRTDFPVAKLGNSDTVQVGDWAYAMGNPFLLATDFQPTITYGIVSGVHRYQYPAGTFLEYTDCIQVDSSINPGNSGGPLFNDRGELIGINGRGSFEKRGRVNSGAGYAISINQIKHFWDHLKSGRIVDHASLGATVTTSLDSTIDVAEILEDSDAYRKGLRLGDEIVSFAGRPIRSVNQFKNILGIYPAGWTLPLVYRRDEKKHTIYVRLQALHTAAELQEQAGQKKKPPVKPSRPGEEKPPQMPNPHAKPEPAPPEQYKHLYIPKTGFTNYYFNQQQQDRLLQALNTTSNFSDRKGTWSLTGKQEDGSEFTLTLADKGVGFEAGNDIFLQSLETGTFVDEPPGTGGLLAALHHFRLLLSGQSDRFTDFYYLGSELLDGKNELVDVLVATQTGTISRWYFNKADLSLRGFDFYLTENSEVCSIRFEQFQTLNGQKFPGELDILYGNRPVMKLKVERLKLETLDTPKK
ncbi:Periplasmic serine endoprotease DegP precursor [Gimesia alba]|uniref:Periplasmic serine endoprotease DegP n=1 Tax=Gimesia alba TaxID=2527973 RepID=A0A517RBB4_9PLAN|nr:trypsin-like peptidase domain-containing protein [Gimesia alba]QDT41170.1 Periplasmic serine endoprotease DegP precursor [Gimesia alba]